jgi:hypothetical protein
MAKHGTSARVAKMASKQLRSRRSTSPQKAVAGSDLSQKRKKK